MTMSDQPELPSLEKNDADPFLRLENGSTEVYLIRHADALPDASEVVGGGYDHQSLSELGRRQSLALAERLGEDSIAAIYSSPIKRAWETASFIGEALGLEVYVDEELREVDLGPIPPHLLAHAMPEERAAAVRAYLHGIEYTALQVGFWSQIPGCEPSELFRARLTETVGRIAKQYPGKRIAVVSHTGVINAYIAVALGLERDFFFPAANASISAVRVKDRRYLLMKLNDTAHLRREGLGR